MSLPSAEGDLIMKENLTELVFILDKSGSMSGLEDDTIGGYNSLVEKQKHEDGEAILSTILFSDYRKVLHNRVNIKEVKPCSVRRLLRRTTFLYIGSVRSKACPPMIPTQRRELCSLKN